MQTVLAQVMCRVARKVVPVRLRHALRMLVQARPRHDQYVRRMLAGQDVDIRAVERLIQPSDGMVIDVGAEEGEVTRHFAEREFRVLAFEPSRRNVIALLSSSLRYVLTGRVRAFRMACSDFDGTAVLNTSGPSWAYSLRSPQTSDEEPGGPVPVVRLGPWLVEQGIKQVAFLKVDAEGSDFDVLCGYWSHPDVPSPKVVMFEFTCGELERMLNLMGQKGYRHFRFICRWNEAAGQESQIRLLIADGVHPLVFDAEWGNAICSIADFRVLHPLTGS